MKDQETTYRVCPLLAHVGNFWEGEEKRRERKIFEAERAKEEVMAKDNSYTG